MQRCTFCGLEIPTNAQFCGHCGQVIADTVDTHAPTSISELPTSSLSFSDAPAAPGELFNSFQPPVRKSTLRPDQAEGQWWQTAPPGAGEDKDKREGPVVPGVPWPGAMAGGSQVPIANVPAVHGMPQAGTVPSISGTPSITPGHMAQPAAASGESAWQGAAGSGHSMSQGAASGQAMSQGAAGSGYNMSQGAAAPGHVIQQGAAGSGEASPSAASGHAISQGAAGSGQASQGAAA